MSENTQHTQKPCKERKPLGFWKTTWASMLGVVFAFLAINIICFICMLCMVSAFASMSKEDTVTGKNLFMKVDMTNSIVEHATDDELSSLFSDDNATGMDNLLAAITAAKDDSKISGIYLYFGSGSSADWAQCEEIRNALVDFKSSSKAVVTYADTYTQQALYLASVADRISLHPAGMVEWRGIGGRVMFYKDLLEKVGVEMQIFKVGTYKSAVEPYFLTEMSDANKEQMTEMVSSIWKNITEDVSASRNLSVDKLNQLADQTLMFYPAKDAVNNGMLDTLIYKNDVRDYLKKMADIGEDDKLPLLGVKEMVNVNRNVPKDKSGNIIAVYYASGEIDGTSIVNTGSQSGIVSDKVISDLRKLKEDKDVKAVVLRVNSPGGSAYGSEQIWYAISELKKEKPVIISMSDYAASGGYYISCAADVIVAEPTTLTGSIGIFGTVPNIQKLKEKVGISIDLVKTNEHSDFQGTSMLTRPMTESEKDLMQMYVNNGYDLFTTRVADGRNLSKTRVDEIGQGRVWTGERAKELGLVDELGGIDKAVSIAVDRAGVETYTLLSYPAEESMFSKLMNESPTNYVKSNLLKSQLGDLYYQYEFINNFQINDMLQMRMPYKLNIH